MSSIDKRAQKRSRIDRLKQHFNIGDAALGWLDPTYRQFRKNLFAADKQARLDATKLKEFKYNAEMAFKQKNYLYAAAQIGYYYDLVGKISDDLRQIFSGFDADEVKLLVDHLDPETQQYIKSRLSKKSEREDQIIKVAVLDWLRSFLSTRRRAISILEKNFGSKNIQKLRDGLGMAIKKLNVLHANILKSFEAMSAALADADYDQYRTELGKLFVAADLHRKEYDDFFVKSVEPYHDYITQQISRLEKPLDESTEVQRQVDESAQVEPQLPESEPQARPNVVAPPSRPGLGEPKLWEGYAKNRSIVPDDMGPSAVTHSPEQLALPHVNMRPTSVTMPGEAPAPAVNPDTSKQLSLLDYDADAAHRRRVQNKINDITKDVLSQPASPELESEPLPAPTPAKLTTKPAPKKPAAEPVVVTGPKPENRGRGRKKPAPAPGSPADKTQADDDYYAYAYDHSEFLTKLAACETKSEMINSLLSYSEHLEDINEEESLKLLAIAEGLMESK